MSAPGGMGHPQFSRFESIQETSSLTQTHSSVHSTCGPGISQSNKFE